MTESFLETLLWWVAGNAFATYLLITLIILIVAFMALPDPFRISPMRQPFQDPYKQTAMILPAVIAAYDAGQLHLVSDEQLAQAQALVDHTLDKFSTGELDRIYDQWLLEKLQVISAHITSLFTARYAYKVGLDGMTPVTR